MICPCGGRTLTASAREAGMVLTWERCGSCTRCWDFEFEVRGLIAAEGEQARAAFRDRAERHHLQTRTTT